MTLPQLYTNVTLRSYDHIRNSPGDGRPEGCGMGSPFAMGLNGLVLRNNAGYVKKLRLVGEYKEHDLEESSKNGRVPDSGMMLNTLVRVAVERSVSVTEFCWELNTKMLPTVWHGLVHSRITCLTVRFPSSRSPRPIIVVPPLPSLVSLKIIDIDPLCYGDDISLLLAESEHLRELKLIWSPRMHEAREPSVKLGSIFGRRRLTLAKFAIKNLYHHSDGWCPEYYDQSAVEEVTVINSWGGHDDHPESAFIHSRLRCIDISLPRLKLVRGDKVSKELVELLAKTNGLEKLYIIGPKKPKRPNSDNAFPRSPVSNGSTPPSELRSDSLKEEHLEAITRNHGATLRHLLLPPQWRLTSDNIALIVRNCPNLEQIAFGADFDRFPNLRLLMPFLPKLFAMRLLDNPDNSDFRDKMHELDDGRHEAKIGGATSACEWSKLRWMELADLVFEVGRVELMEDSDNPGKMSYRRKVWKRDREAVKDIEIWKMDSLDVF
ncbi:MAG: hypothetical protein Q9201_001214 [Fulgogasparrea decipioides]